MDRTARLHPVLPSVLVGILAGLASALIYAGPVQGSAFSLLLSFFTMLPLFVAGIGWGLAASASATVTSCAGLMMTAHGPWIAADSVTLGGFFFATMAAPAALMSHLTLLARPGDPLPEAGGPPNPDHWEWFPLGWIALWVAALSVALFIGLDWFVTGPDGGIKAYFVRELAEFPDGSEARRLLMTYFPGASWAEVSRLLSSVLPSLIGVSWQFMVVINGILAEQILRASNRAIRPRFEFARMVLPRFLTAAIAIALVFALIDSSVAFIAGTVAALLFVPYFFLGLTVVHAIPARGAGRVALLALFYCLLMFVGWLSLVVGLLGLVEQWVDLRARFMGTTAAARED